MNKTDFYGEKTPLSIWLLMFLCGIVIVINGINLSNAVFYTDIKDQVIEAELMGRKLVADKEMTIKAYNTKIAKADSTTQQALLVEGNKRIKQFEENINKEIGKIQSLLNLLDD